MTNILNINAITGETIVTELTKAEISARQEVAEASNKVRTDEAEATATAKAALLERLGITADEAALLLA